MEEPRPTVYKHRGTTLGTVFLIVFLVALVLLVVSLAMRSLLAIAAIFMAPPIMVIALVAAAYQFRLKRIILTEEGFYLWVGGKKRFKAKWTAVRSVANADPRIEEISQIALDVLDAATAEDYDDLQRRRSDTSGSTKGTVIFRTERRTLKLKPGSHFRKDTLREIFRFACKMQKRYPHMVVEDHADGLRRVLRARPLRSSTAQTSELLAHVPEALGDSLVIGQLR